MAITSYFQKGVHWLMTLPLLPCIMHKWETSKTNALFLYNNYTTLPIRYLFFSEKGLVSTMPVLHFNLLQNIIVSSA